MYELSIALKYLVPRLRYLSVSIISVISIFVIATVVWLTIVFFSATEGLEQRWTQKLIAITAPVRLIPTDSYYRSYYYNSDAISEASHFTSKTLAEKLRSPITDPYNPEIDPALSKDFPKPLVDENGKSIDLLKAALQAIQEVQGAKNLSISTFETAFANVHIRLVRPSHLGTQEASTQLLTQASYLMNFDPEKKNLDTILLPQTAEDRENCERIQEEMGITSTLSIEKHDTQWLLPMNATLGQGVLLPKSFRDAGVKTADSGYFSYFSAGATALQEQRLPFFVAGFYDPGIIPIGGKLILTTENVVSLVQSASLAQDTLFPTGINVNFSNYKNAEKVKSEIQQNLKKRGLTGFFTVESYDHYDFTKDIFQQLKSEKNLFSLISVIIVIVACSNIISMLVILVHDKEKEVAILRALGATKASIGFVFGLCGFLMGALGSIIGAIIAYFTVKNLPLLLAFLGKLQGFDVLNASFYGTSIPTEVSIYSVFLVVIATAVVSTLAGIVAAFKASHQNTSDALRE